MGLRRLLRRGRAAPGFLAWRAARPLATACGLCGRVLGPDGIWRAPAAAQPPREELSHGFCPPCARKHHPYLFDEL